MWPIVFDPFKELQDIERRLGTVLNTNRPVQKVEAFTSAVNEKVDKKGYHLEVDLPVVNKENIEAKFENGVLKLSIPRRRKPEGKKIKIK